MKKLKIEKFKIYKFGAPERDVYKASDLYTKRILKNTAKALQSLYSIGNPYPRYEQSILDIQNLEKFKYSISIDVKKFFPNCYLGNYLESIADEDLKQRLYEIYTAEVKNENTDSRLTMRAGLSTSNMISNHIVQELKNKLTREFPTVVFYNYCDDFVFYCNEKRPILECVEFAESYLKGFNLFFHPVGKKNSGLLNNRVDGKSFSRLGLDFYVKQNTVYSKLRAETKRRYELKLRKDLLKVKTEIEAIEVVKRKIFGRRGLYAIFSGVWTCRLDRALYTKRILKVISKATYKKGFSTEGIFELAKPNTALTDFPD